MTNLSEKQLQERRHYLGASEVASVLGANPWQDALGVYAAKVDDFRTPDNRPMEWGRRLEALIGEAYGEETGRPVFDAQEIVHPDLPFLRASLDRRTIGTVACPAPGKGEGPLELKSVGGKMWVDPNDWKLDPPIHYQIQVQIQMSCHQSAWGSLCGLFPGYQLAWTDLLRDDDFLNAAYPVLDEFWQRVLRRDPPTASGKSLDVIKHLYNSDTGETITLGNRELDLADRWKAARAKAREVTDEIKDIEAILRSELKDATYGALPDGSFLSLKTQRRKSYVVEANEFRVLRRVKNRSGYAY